jgi:hypothetical protein
VIVRALGYRADFYESAESDPITITVIPSYSLSAAAAGGGTVTLSPSGGVYPSNTVVTLTANPAVGWTFLQWLGDATGYNASTNVTLTRNMSVRAVFGTTLGTTAAGNGSVQVTPLVPYYPYGTIVWLTGIPQPGSYFAFWGNAASGNLNPLPFTVTNANPTISSLFASLGVGQVALTVVSIGGGRTAVSPHANAFLAGQTATLTATPDAGQSFLGWSGNAAGNQNPLPLVMDQTRVVYANFTHGPTLGINNNSTMLRSEGAQMTLRGDFGAPYQIQITTNFTNWRSLLALTNFYGTSQFTDPSATNGGRSFYRALLLQ